jgi:hypothetical protein
LTCERRMPRSLLIAALLLGCAYAHPEPAASPVVLPFARIGIQSCPSADSLIGPLGDDKNAYVRLQYDSLLDRTTLTTIRAVSERYSGVRFDGYLWYPGRGPHLRPEPRLNVGVYGRTAVRLTRIPDHPPTRVVLDDSVSLQIKSVNRGTLERSSPQGPRIPISLELGYDDFIGLATARRAVVEIGERRFQVDSWTMRDMRGLLRVSVCGPTAR